MSPSRYAVKSLTLNELHKVKQRNNFECSVAFKQTDSNKLYHNTDTFIMIYELMGNILY